LLQIILTRSCTIGINPELTIVPAVAEISVYNVTCVAVTIMGSPWKKGQAQPP
jgi:hypothetical protein